MAGTANIKDVRSKVSSSSKFDPEGNSKAIIIKHVPFGFFEKELLSYFLQFGNIRRIRIPRNKRTSNHKGWAFVLFTDHNVAQLAAEAMDGYLMFEKRLILTAISGKVVKNKNFPKCLCKGPRIIQPPAKYETAKRHAMQMNRVQSGWNEEIAHSRLLKKLKKKEAKLAELCYQLPPVGGSQKNERNAPATNKTQSTKEEQTEVGVERIEEHDEKLEGTSTAKKWRGKKSRGLMKLSKKGR